MTLLVLGLVLWTAAHLFKRLAPGARASLDRAVGDGPAKGAIALVILAGVVLMVIGYRAAPVAPVYAPPAWGIHVNNLAMFAAVLLMGAGRSKSRARAWLRNPMLTGVAVWALAHLLVNGDVASLVLFGWLGLWAVGSIALIDAQDPAWTRPEPGTTAGDIRLVVIAAVIYAVIAAIHAWLGYWPFPQ
jgi:uncharacterized membrane protein